MKVAHKYIKLIGSISSNTIIYRKKVMFDETKANKISILI